MPWTEVELYSLDDGWHRSIDDQRSFRWGKPLFEMCWFYMGFAQIDLPTPLVKRANVEKRVPQTILASPYTPGQIYAKNAPNHHCKPFHVPSIEEKGVYS